MDAKRAIFWNLVGLSAYWPLLRRNCVSVLSAADMAAPDAKQWLYPAFILCFALGGILLGWRTLRSDDPARGLRRVLGISLAAGVAALVASWAVPGTTGAVEFALCVAASCCNALFMAAASVAWAFAVHASVSRHRVMLCAGSFAASFVLSLPFALLPSLNPLCAVALQTVSGVSCLMVLRTLSAPAATQPLPSARSDRDGAAVPGSPIADRPEAVAHPFQAVPPRRLRRIVPATGAGEGRSIAAEVLGGGSLSGMSVVLVLFLLVGGLIRGAVGSGVLSGIGIDQFALEKALLSLGLAVVVLAIVFFSEENGRFAYACWAVLSVAFFGALFYLAVSSPDEFQLVGIAIIPCRTFLGFLLWVVLVESVRRRSPQAAALIGCVFVPTEALSWVLSDYGVLVAVRGLGIDVQQSLGALSLVMALFLIAAVFVLLRASGSAAVPGAGAAKGPGGVGGSFGSLGMGRASADPAGNGDVAADGAAAGGASGAVATSVEGAGPDGGASRGDGHQARLNAVRQLQERFGLTDREAEVALLASQGHSYKHIADALFISQSTTQTHVRNVYRKLDVHRRQDLIDLVNATIED